MELTVVHAESSVCSLKLSANDRAFKSSVRDYTSKGDASAFKFKKSVNKQIMNKNADVNISNKDTMKVEKKANKHKRNNDGKDNLEIFRMEPSGTNSENESGDNYELDLKFNVKSTEEGMIFVDEFAIRRSIYRRKQRNLQKHHASKSYFPQRTLAIEQFTLVRKHKE